MADQYAAPAVARPDLEPDLGPDINSCCAGSEVVVLGGGIAGIATALALLDAGRRVTLIEARHFLGGRAFSFTDAATGQSVDNGQHVIVGCCSHFIQFLERLGVRDAWSLQPHLRLPVFDRRGQAGALVASWLPAPFHLLPSFLTYPHLGVADKVRALAGMVQAKFTDRRRPGLERITFYQWLREKGQTERAIQNLWNLVAEPTLNDNVREVSAAMGLMIVQDGILQGRHNANLGYPRQGLLPSIGIPARKVLEERGARLILGHPARRILFDPGRSGSSPVGSKVGVALGPVIGIELASGEKVSGQEYVSALPFNAMLGILPPEAAALPFFQGIKGLEWSPIVNIHLRYDRPVMDGDFCAFVDSPLQWVFNKSWILAIEPTDLITASGQYITVSVSAAWNYIDRPREELARQFIAEMAEVFPAARDAQVEGVTVVKQREATFRCRPGTNELRPDARTPIPNFFLAGEWTNTGWPSTMESAVRSGHNAAQAIVRT